ncbi:RNA-guided endonuclease TnpB family protein [Clostridium pasteurianum]|nr:RNA-guided endonuclease TnpB family protein [Clostridium pasteurianum]
MNYKKLNGQYPIDKDLFGKTYRNVVEGYMKEIMNIVNTSNVSQTNAFVLKKWNSDKQDILNYRKSVASFKLNMPIYIYNKNYKIIQGNNGYEIDAAIFNKKQDLRHVTFNIDKLDNNKKVTLNKIISGIYKQGAAQIIQDKKGKWYFIISFSFVPDIKELDKNRILGVDLGITNTATLQIWDNNEKKWDKLLYRECILDGKESIHFRQKVEARRRSMLISCKVAGDGRSGHGTKTKIRSASNIGDKINNFRDTLNHKYSKYIVDFAVKHNCGTVQLEDLTGFNPENNFLKSWPYFDMQSKIKYKSKEKGIDIKIINPYKTSQRCSICGCIDKLNRDSKNNQSIFKCINCGYEEHADINAAKNIALPNIEKLIKNFAKIP